MNEFKSATKTKIIGLTGGIASGKSTVAKYLTEKYQISVINLDEIASEIREKEEFQEKILAIFGTKNRHHLADLIFSDPQKKQQLEALLHPPTIKKMHQLITGYRQEKQPLVVIESAILFEVDLALFCDQIWIIETTPELQKQRLRKRNPELTSNQISQRLNSQASNQNINQSSFSPIITLNNNANPVQLFTQIDQLLN